ncbi:uncharacterized protein LOC143301992 [Babylonia areolata]|uniref:uncharacterized protein LOC143301992 n=1 Tax=Babylonia areolata TaxID=304850 RepID=UPI003FCFED08
MAAASSSSTSLLPTTNGSPAVGNVTYPSHQPLSPEELYPVVAVLSVFSVTGVVGNAIAFYVFSTLKKQPNFKLTSTIFILALAGTDFITCLITIPFTIIMELIDFKLQVDFFCKFYHFLITTTVPFSAFVMVVIAVDRYLCICHPFLHWMTQRRAKIIIACLAVFIFCIGGVICIHYSIYEETEERLFEEIGIEGAGGNGTQYRTNGTVAVVSTSLNMTVVTVEEVVSVGVSRGKPKIVETITMRKQCDRRENTIDVRFFNALQRIYSGFFLVSCIAVLILYSLIYQSVVAQRRKKLRIRSAQCCSLWKSSSFANGEASDGVTTAVELTQVNGDNSHHHRTEEYGAVSEEPPSSMRTTNFNGGSASASTSASTRVRASSSLPRTRLERMRMANIKTALMLFVVTLVFIFSFLPSWLIALKIMNAPVMVFYMYFFYNVVNPIIYAFMNQNFRTELKKMFRCQ